MLYSPPPQFFKQFWCFYICKIENTDLIKLNLCKWYTSQILNEVQACGLKFSDSKIINSKTIFLLLYGERLILKLLHN